MTNTDRAAAIARLLLELQQLTTEDERRDYPFAEHLADLIEDLEPVGGP